MTTTRDATAATFRIRPIATGDRAGLTRFYEGLSPESRAARFHGAASCLRESTATFFCGPDHEHREGIVAESVGPDGGFVIIGHVCIEPVDQDVAEMAIAVADAWQRRGVGRSMLGEAISWAQRHGLGRLMASVQWTNPATLDLLRSMGYPITPGGSGAGTIDTYIEVSRTRPRAA